MLLEGRQIIPPDKVVMIGEQKTRAGIKMTLHKLHILKDYTRLFASIENIDENKEITLYTPGLKAIQRKKQFEYSYESDRKYRMIKSTIPPGVVEEGVLILEPLDNSVDHVKFLVPFHTIGIEFNYF
jgi:hypothetical protein